MALIPSSRYPAQTVADADWPQGKARNSVTFGDGSGTPLEADWVNDLFGFQQAMLANALITPSGNPDKVGTSQYLDALQLRVAMYNLSGFSTASGVKFTLSEIFQRGGFTLISSVVRVPSPGRYVVWLSAGFLSASVTNPMQVDVSIGGSGGGGSFSGSARATRFSATATDTVRISLISGGLVTDPADGEQNITIMNGTASAMTPTGSAQLIVLKL